MMRAVADAEPCHVPDPAPHVLKVHLLTHRLVFPEAGTITILGDEGNKAPRG